MATTITDTGASLTITIGTQAPRNILKAKITELTIIKTNILKIDVGKGALDNIFIPYSDVVFPITANPAALRSAINTMLAPAVTTTGPVGGVATAPKQDQGNLLLNNLNGISEEIHSVLQSLDYKIFHQPLLVDEDGSGTIYKGYALIGSSQELYSWAIERIQKILTVEVHTWADGNRDLNKRWIERKSLLYY